MNIGVRGVWKATHEHPFPLRLGADKNEVTGKGTLSVFFRRKKGIGFAFEFDGSILFSYKANKMQQQWSN